ERAHDRGSGGERAIEQKGHGDPWSYVLPWAVAALLAVVAGTSVWRLAHPDAPLTPPVARFDVTLPPGRTLDSDARALAWSPSGARLAYVACAPDACRLHVRALDDPRAQPIAGTDGAAAPFFSPDEAWVGFFADGKLKTIAVAGGTPIAIAEARHPLGATWLADGPILVASALAGGLQRVSAAGGETRRATDVDAGTGELRHEQPEAVAGSRTILMTAILAPGPPLRSRIVGVSLDSGQQVVLVD